MSKFIIGSSSDRVFMALHDGGVIPDEPSDVRRVIIDLQIGNPARVYVERFLDDSFIELTLAGGLQLTRSKARKPPGELDDEARIRPSFRPQDGR
jgi:hypothetical protein